MNRSLKKDILKFLIVFLVTIIIVIGSFTIYEQYQQRLKEVSFSQYLVLKQVEEEIEKLLQKVKTVKKYLLENYEKNNEFLEYLVKTNDEIISIMILNNEGIVLDHYTQHNYNIYKGFDYSTKDFFKNLKDKESAYSKIYETSLQDKPALPYSFKMNDRVIVIAIDLSNFSRFLYRFKNHDASYMIKVFDKEGILVLDPNIKRAMIQDYNAKPSEVFTKLINIAKFFEQVTFKSAKTEKLQLGSYFNIEILGWSIVVRNEYDFILKSLTSMFISYIIAILIIIIISVYITIKITNNIFKSFDEIEIITSNIADGKYHLELKDLYYDEFNNLLKSFNKMQTEIDKREVNLENSLNSFKALFNSTMESVILHNKGICFDLNDVCVKLFKADSKDELIGKSILDFVSDKDKELLEKNLDINSDPFEVEFILMDGTTIQTLIQGKVVELKGKHINITAIIDISELKEKDKLLFHKSKLASMGEMIENIAHHWRQPLSVISIGASGLKMQKELDLLTDEFFEKTCDTIDTHAQFLSKTIDSFRSYFKGDTVESKFNLKTIIDNFRELTISTTQEEHIQIVSDLNLSVELEGYPNELIQCFINLLNNSKDAFIKNNIDKNNRYIFIEEKIINKQLVINFKDTAGGIPSEILPKVFEPYFTTKHQAQGVGLGLHMVYSIIGHSKGTIKADNINFEYNNIQYKGAQFTITIPL